MYIVLQINSRKVFKFYCYSFCFFLCLKRCKWRRNHLKLIHCQNISFKHGIRLCRVTYSTELQMCFFSQTKIVQIQGYENVFSLFLPFNNVHLWSPSPGGRSVKKEKWISDRRDGFKKQSWTTTKIFNLEDNKGPRLLSRQRLQAWHQRWVHRGNFRCWRSASVVHHLLRVHGGGVDLRLPDGWHVHTLLRGMSNK